MITARATSGLAALDATLYAVGGDDGTNILASSEYLVPDATCNATTPRHPPTPDPTDFTPLVIYRMQGKTWVANISNADAADLNGLSCFIERNSPEWLPKYGAHPVVARYHVAAYAPDTRPVSNHTGYKDCTEAPPRTCSDYRGNAYRVGVEATSVTSCSYNGSWYSLPIAGECRAGCDSTDPGSPCLGQSCFWQVTAIDKIVGWDCLQSHGCNATIGGCPPTTLRAAFDACPDLCTPPVDGCSNMPSFFIGNSLSRYAFDPNQCATCLAGGSSVWSTASAAPTAQNWTCGAPPPKYAGSISFGLGKASGPRDACRCHYSDLAPSPPPACPHGSLDACKLACTDLPSGAAIEECLDYCAQWCAH